MRKTAFQIIVAGGKGQGKSALTKEIARARSRVIAFDVLGEYPAQGYRAAYSFAQVLQYVRKGWRRGFRIAFIPPQPPPDIPDAIAKNWHAWQLSELCDFLCKVQQPYYDTPDGRAPSIAKLLLIVEEMAWSYPSHCPYAGFQKICTLGRHYGIDVIGTTQRFPDVSTKFRGTCDLQFFFAQHDHNDLQVIGRMIGPAARAQLQRLRPHEFLRVFRGRVEAGKNRLR